VIENQSEPGFLACQNQLEARILAESHFHEGSDQPEKQVENRLSRKSFRCGASSAPSEWAQGNVKEESQSR
jgi:hypothetical protein